MSLAHVSVRGGVALEHLHARAYTVPTERPESDGTLEWEQTTIVVASAAGGGEQGIGWTYGDKAIAPLIEGKLAPVVCERDAFDVHGTWAAMVAALRNEGRPGHSSMAVAAITAMPPFALHVGLLIEIAGRVRAARRGVLR